MASDLLFPADQTATKSGQEELFVFGYSCKLFRDDDQAKLVDLGKYMIPWMGDERLKIDRSVYPSTRSGNSIVNEKGFVNAFVDCLNQFVLVLTGFQHPQCGPSTHSLPSCGKRHRRSEGRIQEFTPLSWSS